MYAAAISGSPRRGGNTDIMLGKILDSLKGNGWETKLIGAGGKPIRGCTACYACWKNKNMQCAVKSDEFNGIFAEMAKADAIIIGSPTYFTDVTAETKAVIDRAGMTALANDCAFKSKIGAAVVAVRRGGATHAFDSINHMFLMSRMVVPGSTYWNFGMGRETGEVENDQEGIANMLQLASAIDWLGKAIKPHSENYPV
jgi:multimeric flavodoxin WrbA